MYTNKKYELKLPDTQVAYDMFISNNVLFLYPNIDWESLTDDFSSFYKKTIFHTRICHFREYKNEETGECEPCPNGSTAKDGPFSKNCVDKKTGKKVVQPVEVEEVKEEVEKEVKEEEVKEKEEKEEKNQSTAESKRQAKRDVEQDSDWLNSWHLHLLRFGCHRHWLHIQKTHK